jgi:hypothetical protein
MSRLLPLVALLAACAWSEPPARSDVVSSYRSLHTWLDTWIDARHCIIGNAPDSLTGVTIEKLVGRDCSRQLHQLEVHVATDDESVNSAWRGVIEHAHVVASSSDLLKRAQGIDELDALARTLGLAIGRWVPPLEPGPPLEHLPDHRPMFGGKPAFPRNLVGGYVTGGQFPPEGSTDMALEVDRLGNPLRYPEFIYDTPRPAFARIQDPTATVTLWFSSDHTYSVDVTTDGATRSTHVKGQLIGHWQHPITGEIVVFVNDHGDSFIHRYRPGSTTRIVEPAPFWDRFDARATCLSSGDVWLLLRETVTRVNDKERWLMPVGEISLKMTMDCRGDTALVLRHDPDVLERCQEGQCEEVFRLEGPREGAAALLDDKRWAYVAELDGIVALWVEGEAEPRTFRLRGDSKLVAVAVDRGELLLISVDPMRRYWSVALPTAAKGLASTVGQNRPQP